MKKKNNYGLSFAPIVPFKLYALLFSLTSFYAPGNLQNCLYSKSEKMLGSRDLGARVIIQSFPEEPSQVQLEGVQLRDLGQAFREHVSSLTLVGTLAGKEAIHSSLFFPFPYSRLSMQKVLCGGIMGHGGFRGGLFYSRSVFLKL